MTNNEKLFGFHLCRTRPLPKQKASLHEYFHLKSGARLIWLEREEQNKTFCVSFKTLPEDDSGVFHILEHCVLGGSKKFAVKEPFAELMKNSVNTFLNAMTFGDKTMYPVASRNEKDFFNLMSVYLDGVFNPSVLSHENIFLQEGWHYTFDEEGNPSFQGVVYNEMKGTASTLNHQAYRETLRLLFPDTCYRFEAGGDPEVILDLSYEDFKNAHARFYHPSNAFFFLDGKIPLVRVLEKLDDYLKGYERTEPETDIPWQEPRGGLVRHDFEIREGEDLENKCRLTLACLFASWEEVEKQLAVAVLCDLLAGSNEAPLKKAILNQGLAEDFHMSSSGGTSQIWFSMEAHNTSEDRFPLIKESIRSSLLKLAEEGLDRADLLASLNQLHYRELDPMEPRGIILAMASLSSWLYGGDPALYLNQGPVFESLREKIPTGYFEQLLLEFVPDGERFVEIQSFPSVSYGQVRDAREARRLEERAGAWSAQEKKERIQKAVRLKNWQETPDSPEALASLPGLVLEDLAEEPVYLETRIKKLEDVTLLYHPTPAPGLLYLKLYFDLSDQPLEDLPALRFTTLLFGKLATRNRDAKALVREVKTHIGQLDFQLQPVEDPGRTDRCKLYLAVTLSLLEGEADKALDLVHDILTNTLFDDKATVHTLLLQNREYLRQAVGQMPHDYGTMRVKGHHTAKDAGQEALEGLTFILWANDFLDDFDAAWEGWKSLAKAFCARVFTRERLTVSVTGNLEEKKLDHLVSSYPKTDGPLPSYASYTALYPEKEGLPVPSAVSYVCMGCHMKPFGGAFSGSWMALDQILSMEYLWNKIRVQGGAYGTGLSTDKEGGSVFHSFMDPTPAKSLAVFRGSSAFIRDFCQGQKNIARYAMGKVADLDPDLSYKGQADQADHWFFTGYDREQALQLRRELLEVTPKDLLALVDILEEAFGQASLCIAGPPEALEGIEGLTLIDIG